MHSNGPQTQHVDGWDILGLSDPYCSQCEGLGRVSIRYVWNGPVKGSRACGCVYRRAFRDCIRRYWESREFGPVLRGAVRMQYTAHAVGRLTMPRAFRHAEYVADIELNARRALSGRPILWAVWWYAFVHVRPWHECVRLIRRDVGIPLDRGRFFTELYRVQFILGRVFLELKPYGLYPADYFTERKPECSKPSI